MFARAAASVVIAGAIVFGTSGCNFFAPQSTLHPYDASDGVSVTVGDVKVLNAMGLSEADGAAVSFLATIANTGSRGVSVNLQYTIDGEKQTVTKFVNAGAAETFGYEGEEGEQLIMLGTGVEPGGLVPVFVQYGTETGKTMLVPVLDGSLPEYETLVPQETAAG